MIVSRRIRNAARGENCTVNIVGVCSYNPESTVLAHLPDESKGMGKKADDISAVFACYNCHQAIDRREYNREFEESREWYLRRAMVRTWRRLIEMGIVVIR